MIAVSIMVFLVVLLLAPTKYSDSGNMSLQARTVASSTSSTLMQANIRKQNFPLFSVQIDAGMMGDEDQSYFIPSPDL
jgi:hypothetical protein